MRHGILYRCLISDSMSKGFWFQHEDIRTPTKHPMQYILWLTDEKMDKKAIWMLFDIFHVIVI
jgi:hypothetical protein